MNTYRPDITMLTPEEKMQLDMDIKKEKEINSELKRLELEDKRLEVKIKKINLLIRKCDLDIRKQEV